ncbi:MAG: hypothetical protein ACXWQO_06455 [Bdellovibrionota bacterium]
MIYSLLFLLLSVLPAQAATPCTSEQVLGEGVVASRFSTVALGCVVQVTPRQKPEMRYREFWIDERGRFMVFVSVPGDDLDKATGTRTYFLFPRKQLPAFTLLANGNLSFNLGTGQSAIFGATDAQLMSFPGEFTLDSAVNLENQGGLEIKSYNGIWLDAGWVVGSQSYKDPKGSSVLSDSHNQKCSIRNEEFFFYENMYYNEPNLRYPDDASLAKFLGERCPNLDTSALR